MKRRLFAVLMAAATVGAAAGGVTMIHADNSSAELQIAGESEGDSGSAAAEDTETENGADDADAADAQSASMGLRPRFSRRREGLDGTPR